MKRALITGASSGIGEACAYLLASKKIELILCGRDKERLDRVTKKAASLAVVEAELKTKEGRKKVIEAIQTYTPDLIINNAGFGLYGESIVLSLEEQEEMIEVNIKAVLEFTIEGARMMVQKSIHGIILNVSSAAGDYPTPGMSVYGASKAFVTKFSQATHTELKPKGIAVLASCPGMVTTDFANRAAKKPVSKTQGPIMTPSFAAEEIWKQIKKRKEIHTFNRFYRFFGWAAGRLIPISLVKRIIWKNLNERISK